MGRADVNSYINYLYNDDDTFPSLIFNTVVGPATATGASMRMMRTSGRVLNSIIYCSTCTPDITEAFWKVTSMISF